MSLAPFPRMRPHGVLCALLIVLTSSGCGAPEASDDGGEESAVTAATDRRSPFVDMPVVVLRVDDATQRWISQQTSIVDAKPVGTDAGRQRELYLRLQQAINVSSAPPTLVHYGLHFASRDDARAITDRFSAAVDASKVPVILERNTALGTADATLYHNWSWSNPPRLIVSETLAYHCAVGAAPCGEIDIALKPSNPALVSLPVAVRAAAWMASGKGDRSDATAEANRDMGVTSDGGYVPLVTFRVKNAASKPNVRVMSLVDVLSNESGARSLRGAAVVVAPSMELEGASTRLADLFAATVADALRAPRVRFGTPEG